MAGKIVILMGSASDEETGDLVRQTAQKFGVKCELRVASAHRTPQKVLELLKEYEDESKTQPLVLVAVVGLSNALSGMAAANTFLPVVTCPTDKGDDLYSSLRMPTGVAHATVLKAENAALHAVRILAVADTGLQGKIADYLAAARKKIEDADEQLKG